MTGTALWAIAEAAGFARATHNPMYAVLIDALSHFMNHVQLTLHDHFARNNALVPNRKMTLIFHDSLIEAIRDRDPQYARVLMQSHLRADAKNVTTSGLLTSAPGRNSDPGRSNSGAPSDLLTMVLEQYSG